MDALLPEQMQFDASTIDIHTDAESSDIWFLEFQLDVVFRIAVLWVTHSMCVLTGSDSTHLCDANATFGFVIHFATQRDQGVSIRWHPPHSMDTEWMEKRIS